MSCFGLKSCYFVEKAFVSGNSAALISPHSQNLVHSLCNITYLVCAELKCDPWPRSLSCKNSCIMHHVASWDLFSDGYYFIWISHSAPSELQLGRRRGLLITHDINAAICLLLSYCCSLSYIHFVGFKHLFEEMIRHFIEHLSAEVVKPVTLLWQMTL